MSRELLQYLYRYCLCLTREKHLAEDLLQNAVEKWLNRLPYIQGTQESKQQGWERPYLRKVIRNLYIDECRRQAIVAFEPLDDAQPALLSTEPLEQIELREQQIDALFTALNTAEREVLFLWAMEGYTCQEIADELEQPRGTVLSRLHRLKHKAQSILNLLNSGGQRDEA